MAVDDHGLEVLKKAGEEVTPGSKANYYHKVGIVQGSPATAISDSNPLPIIHAKYSTITNSRPNVTTVSTLILAANTSRKYAGGFNQSGGVIFVKLGDAAVVGEGIRITNNEPIIIPDGFTGNVYAIRNIGSGTIEMSEGT